MQYVIGEIFVGLGIAALAGVLIGWFLKGVGSANSYSTRAAPILDSTDDSSTDLDATLLLNRQVNEQKSEVQRLTVELQKLRGRDVTLQAGHSNQVDEINKLRGDLDDSRAALESNRAEFSAFKIAKQEELEHISNKLSAFKHGSPTHDARLNEASETITALRTAVRENERVIETLRARVREGDGSVENLRNQLTTAQRTASEASATLQQREQQFNASTAQMQQTEQQFADQQAGDKAAIEKLEGELTVAKSKASELSATLTKSTSEQKNAAMQQVTTQRELNEQKNKIVSLSAGLSRADSKAAELQNELSTANSNEKALKLELEQRHVELSVLDGQVKSLRIELDQTNAELKSASDLEKAVRDKSAEVVAMNDMLHAAGSKREHMESEINRLKSEVAAHNDAEQTNLQHIQIITGLRATQKEQQAQNDKLRSEITKLKASLQIATAVAHELAETKEQRATLQTDLDKARSAHGVATTQIKQLQHALDKHQKTIQNNAQNNKLIAKLRGELDDVTARRNSLGIQVGELQTENKNLASDFEIRLASKNQTSQQTLATRQQEFVKLEREFAAVTAKRDGYERQIAALEKRFAELDNSTQQRINEIQTELTSVRSEAQQKIKLAAETRNKLQQQLSEISTQRDQLNADNTARQQQLGDREQMLEKMRTELQATVNQRDTFEQRLLTMQQELTDNQAKIQRLGNKLTEADKIKLQLQDSQNTVQKMHSTISELSSTESVKDQLKQQNRNTEQLVATLQQREQELLSEQNRTSELASQVEKSEATASMLQTELQQQHDFVKTLEQKSQTSLNLNKQLAEQSTEIESLREQLFTAQNTQSQIRTESALVEQQQAALERAITTRDNEIARLAAEHKDLRTQLQSQTNQPDNKSSQQPPKELLASINALKQQVVEKDQELLQLQQSNPNSASKNELSRLHSDLATAQADTQRWQRRASLAEQAQQQMEADLARTTQVSSAREQYPPMGAAGVETTTSALNDTRPIAPNRAKPRVFARQSETLPNSIGLPTPGDITTERNVRNEVIHADGRHNLTLLPGVDINMERALNQAGINDFEQIALWSKREISHYAEKIGINPGGADNHAWPSAARRIIDGTYRSQTESSPS